MVKPAAQPKDLKVVRLVVETAACAREHDFPEGDERRRCHLGLKALDLGVCAHCVHLRVVPGASRPLTDAEVKLLPFILQPGQP